MNRVTPLRFGFTGAAILAAPTLAHAHSGPDAIQGLVAGCAHPFTGWDHLIAMLAVGIWAAQLGGRSRWVIPMAFIGMVACGAAVSTPLPALTEPMILSSLFVLGLLIATAARLPVAASASIVAVFAFFHGAGHAAALPAGAGTAAAAAGFLVAAIILHVLGLVAGASAERTSALVTRLLGAAVALTGLAFL